MRDPLSADGGHGEPTSPLPPLGVHAHHEGCECPRTADIDGDGAAAASRRSFLRNTGLLGAGVGAASFGLFGASPARAATTQSGTGYPTGDPYDQITMIPAPSGRWNPDSESRQFTLIVMPDTQYLFDEDRIHPVPLELSFEYVLGCADRVGLEDDNIVFLAHLGDVTQNGYAQEYAAATQVFDLLDNERVAYSTLAGNHDVGSNTDDTRGDTPYLDTFNPKRFALSPTWHSSSPDGYDNCHIFRAGGREWMLLSLDWRMSAAGFAWANAVIKANPTLPVILTTHDLVWADDNGAAYLGTYGQQLWDQLIADNDQIFLTLNGHYWPPGSTTMTNKAGNDVFMHITNYQNRYYGGAAMIRAYRFDLDRNTVDVSTFSPWINMLMQKGEANELALQESQLTSSVDRFSVPLDFDARFNGFAPIPARPPRPPRQMLVHGTVAYWRFDGLGTAGASVAPSTVIKDQTGLGNDLVFETVAGTPGSALTWSANYHPDQPGHASLNFAGQGSPLKGSYFQTVPNAPINANTFNHGYTVEAFFYLPADWNSNQNAWTAMLSRWGTAGQAGKSGGNTDPNEPVVTLSLSGDRELQWCVYPLNQTDESTNWGHELPLGAWWHVAVVNDGATTKMYVDGCEVARNPSMPANGLVTLNLPWMLGGYEYQEVINQIFYGGIGDVRIVNRPLPISQFMIS